MTYDLHGVWDADNPIGSIVQGHTNLTEIKSAAELFWRVNIPASKICMGIGFYGRSFTLSNSGCTTPGCGFKGASNDGPCSAAGGILAYYEIQSVLQKNTAIKPTWDKAAVSNTSHSRTINGYRMTMPTLSSKRLIGPTLLGSLAC
jgi:chitinase